MLPEFREYLVRNGHIKDTRIPYYVKWVSLCYEFLDKAIDQKVSSDQKGQFLRHLSRRHEDWEVKQADYALRLYNYFLSRNGKGIKKDAGDHEKEWAWATEETRRALRLRHRSLSTEKSYLFFPSYTSFSPETQVKPGRDDISRNKLQKFP